MQKEKRTQSGFTLVELSIVIVIIGLIVAGVVAGQSLVKEAQLRAIISEQEGIRSSLNSFKLQYNALPGDMENALDYWANGCLNTGVLATASDADECNGDADRRVENAAGDTGESYMAWYHLSRANLYSGSFAPGTADAGSIGVNIPSSNFPGVGITLIFDDATSDATAGDDAASGGRELGRNVILFGGVTAGPANGTLFSATQAFALDQKADDDSPITGSMVGVGVADVNATDCIDDEGTGATTDDNYNVDSTSATPCAIAFVL